MEGNKPGKKYTNQHEYVIPRQPPTDVTYEQNVSTVIISNHNFIFNNSNIYLNFILTDCKKGGLFDYSIDTFEKIRAKQSHG